MNEETRKALSKVIDEHKKKYAAKMAQAKKDREIYQAANPVAKEDRINTDIRNQDRKRLNWNE